MGIDISDGIGQEVTSGSQKQKTVKSFYRHEVFLDCVITNVHISYTFVFIICNGTIDLTIERDNLIMEPITYPKCMSEFIPDEPIRQMTNNKMQHNIGSLRL